MRVYRLGFVAVVSSGLLTFAGCSDQAAPNPEDGETRSELRSPLEQEVIVTFKAGYGPAEKDALTRFTNRAAHYQFRGISAVPIRMPGQALAALRAHPLVAHVDEGVPIVPTQSINPEAVGWYFRLKPDGHGFLQVPAPPPCSFPNPCAPSNPNPNGTGVGVAIVDTGIECTLRDFFRPCSGGVDFTGEGTPFRDVYPHGTLVASILKATGNSPGGIGQENGGIKGIAPSANVYSLRVFDSNNQGNCLRSAQAIDYATFNLPSTVSVINTSYAARATTAAQRSDYEARCQAEKAAVARAVAAKMFISASAGNVSQIGDSVGYPARLPGVMAVSGLDTPVIGACPTFGVTNCKTFFWTGSSRGTQVGIAAAGAKVYVIRPNGAVTTENGTSFSAPIVSGAVAAIYARYGVGRRADA